ncbi:MAG: tRNA pseudouridine(55) synthase TruB [Nannocystaceae bacterium]|nr:tRNA pseudouridine(55) synthase TruB [Myxococcales bacterium]
MSAAASARPFGALILDKPEGPTSHDLVGWVRWALGVRRVGHCGTLDPAASGVLVVCVGPATRLVPYLTGVDKVYEARVELGTATDSADREGEVTATAAVDDDVLARASATLEGMRGLLSLPPPAFSAVKVDGERAHRKARRGDEVALPPRPMTVHDITGIKVHRTGSKALVEATIKVSKGTYIRSLAVELGRRLGVPAHLAGLRRTAAGSLALGASAVAVTASREDGGRWRCQLEGDASREFARAGLERAYLDPTGALPFPRHELCDDDVFTRLAQGQSIALDAIPLPPLADGSHCLVRPGPAGPAVVVIAAVRALADARVLTPERVLRIADHPRS